MRNIDIEHTAKNAIFNVQDLLEASKALLQRVQQLEQENLDLKAKIPQEQEENS